MAVEIERKFLVKKETWQEVEKTDGLFFRQGYLLTDPNKTIRVRLTEQSGYLTVKGVSVGATRAEFEYPIPKEDAQELLDSFAISDLTKVRYKINFGGKTWEIDEFLGKNQGLIVAEIELTTEDEEFELPDWIDTEVTGDARYYNSSLSIMPFTEW